MALCGLSVTHSNLILYIPPLKPTTRRSRTHSPLFSPLTTTLTTLLSQNPKQIDPVKPPICLSKRVLNLTILAVLSSVPLSRFSKSMAQDYLDLELYTDSKEGFTLLKPSSWIKVDKAGATALFEEENKGANNVGVVVTPVRLTSLDEFGTPQFVADKLIQAEKRKESTKDAEVIAVSERSGKGGLHVYEFEYKLDSTRGGMKRIFSAAFVASKKLYLLNIAHSDKPESPLDTHTRTILEQVLHSFDVAPSI
ncbi:hypothetical protein LguiA_036280 [Lonicera macranthoides]